MADITFLVFKPFDFVLKGIFIAAGLMACNESIQESKNPEESKKTGLIRSLWRSFMTSLVMLWKSLKQSKEYMVVYIMAGALTAFYQGLALLLVPLLYALRRLMNIQLSLCTTLFEGFVFSEILIGRGLCRKTRQRSSKTLNKDGGANQTASLLSLFTPTACPKVSLIQ